MTRIKQFKSLLLFVSIGFTLMALNPSGRNLFWGTKTLYRPLQTIYSLPPKGYEPVFINYAGRHGARHSSGIDDDSIMYLALKTAAGENTLTNAGKKLMEMDSLLLIVENGKVGLISEAGKLEQESIGNRMAKNFPEVFNSGNIKVSTTKKERTKQSARAFMKGLNPDKSIMVDTVFNDQTNLAFYDVAPAYKLYKENGNWKALWATVKNSAEVVKLEQELPTRFFTPEFVSKMNSGQIQFYSDKDTNRYTSKSFVEGFYGGCSIIPSIEKEIAKANIQAKDLDFASLVSPEDLLALDYVNTSEDFLLKGPATDPEGIQIKIAVPLLIDFLKSTEEYISSKKTIANLRFAHAETISPFAVLLGITGASEAVSTENIQNFNKTWKCENIIPLSANIQWILYENKTTGDYLVKFLLNEKEATINGLKNCGTAFYYKWSDINAFYTKKVEKLGVQTGDDMHEYLMNVR